MQNAKHPPVIGLWDRRAALLREAIAYREAYGGPVEAPCNLMPIDESQLPQLLAEDAEAYRGR